MDGISINGGVARSNSFTLDGAPNTSREGGTSGASRSCPRPTRCRKCASPRARMMPSSGAPAAGRLRSRSQRHQPSRGSAYYVHRDASLNANLYENIQRGIPKQEIFHYNPGGTIGGPIKKERTFFFYSYEGLSPAFRSAPVSARRPISSAAETSRSRAPSIYDPLNTVNGVPQPFAGNIIPRDRMDAVALNLLQYMPTANSAPDAAGNNFSRRTTPASTPTRRASCAWITT